MPQGRQSQSATSLTLAQCRDNVADIVPALGQCLADVACLLLHALGNPAWSINEWGGEAALRLVWRWLYPRIKAVLTTLRMTQPVQGNGKWIRENGILGRWPGTNINMQIDSHVKTSPTTYIYMYYGE